MNAQVLEKQAPIETRPLLSRDIDLPRLGDNELLIRVSACGICRTDLHVVEGDLAQRRSPLIPGHQVVGKVKEAGKDVHGFKLGDRVGAAWLHSTCGKCRFCASGRENLCEFAEFTGWTRNGGYAEFMVARSDFVYPVPEGFEDTQAAPLLCAGIIGYRALRLTNIIHWAGARLGIYGFGAAGHVCIQIAKARGAQIYVSTRDRKRHQALAEELGATWVGDAFDQPPQKLDAAIIFAPAGEIIPAALSALDNGGTLVLGGIHMSPVPEFEYRLIYGERSIKSVANNTREDGREFLAEAASVPVKTSVQTFDLDQANDALIALKNDAIKGAGVLVSG
jgi:propanol-preferring alcohol dehydrogenase